MWTYWRQRLGVTALFAVAAAVTLAAAAAAGPDAAKQRVAITVTMSSSKGVLRPLNDGALKRDVGRFGGDWAYSPDRTVIRDGQKVEIYTAVWTFTGKRGNLVFRGRAEWIDVGHDLNGDGQQDGIATGTWKVLRGTGRYAGVTGGGRSAQLGARSSVGPALRGLPHGSLAGPRRVCDSSQTSRRRRPRAGGGAGRNPRGGVRCIGLEPELRATGLQDRYVHSRGTAWATGDVFVINADGSEQRNVSPGAGARAPRAARRATRP
jgi:hypothetical protein